MRRPSNKRRLLFCGLGLLSLSALLAWKTLPASGDPLSTVSVTRNDIESSVTALGTLQPRRYVDVGAQASGQIRKLHVEVGDQVKAGQLLVEIDPRPNRPDSMPGASRSTTSRPSWLNSTPSTSSPNNNTNASATWLPAAPPARKMCKAPRLS